MEEGILDTEVELEGEEIVDEDVDTNTEDAIAETVPPDFLDDETRELAAGLVSLDEGELLAALEAMQKTVIGPDGDRVLVAFVLASPHCAEILGAWERGPAAATAVPVLLLLYYMFRHPLVGKVGGTTTSGDYKTGLSIAEKESHRKVMAVKLRLDKLARSIVRTRLKDIYSHLSSSQKSRQNAALLLLSAIVLRGRALAIEIATSFDFTLEALRKLGHPPKQGSQNTTVRVEGHRGMLKRPTRVAFLELAMSFLTVGDPGLLRWILQKRPLWIGVLHGISKDDERTIVRVLTLLREKVMAPAFMVPRGLQSVLFGDATLEQLSRISSDYSLGDAGEIAHATLLSLCTDPSHGLCPEESEVLDSVASRGSKSGGFGGGQGRLLRLILRLKVAEVDRHRDVLLATAQTRPKLAILYLASFPLSLEPRVSPAWFNAMSLVSQLIRIASEPSSFSFPATRSLGPSTPAGHLTQSMILSLIPSSLSRVVLNRGLLHVDFMVKHASLRVLLEALLCLRRLIDALVSARSFETAPEGSSNMSGFAETRVRTEGMNGFVTPLKPAVEEDDLHKQDLVKLSQSIQDIMRASLPDPNTLLAIMSGLKVPQRSSANNASISSEPQGPMATKKRKRKEIESNQELKSSISDTYDYDATIRLLWGLEFSDEARLEEGIDGLLHAKVVQVLAAYQMALPVSIADTGFDAFKLLPDDPTSLSVIQQKSLSALLLATTGCSASEDSGWFVGGFAVFGSAYKNFKQLLMFLLISDVNEVRDAVYEVVYRVMASTGAFESNLLEICLWLDLLVLWKIEKPGGISHNLEGSNDLVKSHTLLPGSSVYASLVDFMSEAVSNIGQNNYKYLDSLHSILSKYVLNEDTENSGLLQSGSSRSLSTSEFGPFVVCALEKCIQTVSKIKVPAALSTVALYVVNVIDFLLNYQMNPKSLAMVVVTLISRERESLPPEQVSSPEWTILLVLFKRARLLLSGKRVHLRGLNTLSGGTLSQSYKGGKLAEVLRACGEDHKTTLDERLSFFTSAMVRVPDQELVDNFPFLMRFCLDDLEGDFSLLIALLEVHGDTLSKVSTAWPEWFTGGLELASRVKYSSEDRMTARKAKELTIMMLGSSSSSTVADTHGLCVLLLVAPFHVLFSAATFCTQPPALLTSHTFTNLLRVGLSRVNHRNWVCMVRLIVSGIKHLADLSMEEIGDGDPLYTCFSLIRSLMLPVQQSLGCSFLSKELTCSSNMIPVYELVIIDLLIHPVFYNLFMHSHRKFIPSMPPCSYVSDLKIDTKDKNICDTSLRRVLASAASSVHPIDCHILSLLTQLLDFSESVVKSANHKSSETHGAIAFWKKILSACEPYIRKAIDAFQKEVDESLNSNSGVVASPALFAVSVLISYTNPSLLLRVFLSLLSTKAVKVKSSKQAVSPQVLALHLVTVFVDSLSGAAVPYSGYQGEYSQALKGETRSGVGGPSVYDLYGKVVDYVTGSPSIMADLCLLSFLKSSKMSQQQFPEFEQHSTCSNRTSTALACSTPLEVLRHCVCHPNKVTGKIALLLVETSEVHLSEFGRLITVGTMDRGPGGIFKCATSPGLAEMLLTQNVTNREVEFVLSDQDLLMLLPAARVYVASDSRRADAKVKNELANHIASLYAKLLTKQLKKWENFVSEIITMDGVQDSGFLISPLQPRNDLHNILLQYYVCSPLGEVVHMLQSCNALHSISAKVRTRLMQSLLQGEHATLVTQNMFLSAGEDISECVFEAMAKADIIKLFLSSQATESVSTLEAAGQEIRQQHPQSNDIAKSQEESSIRQEFLYSLMSTLNMLYKSKALDGNRVVDTVSETRSKVGRSLWMQFLEEYLLMQVNELAKELAGSSSLDTSKYLPLYKHSMTTLLGYRYGEPSAMKACRHLTFVLFQGSQSQPVPKDKSADGDALELLMAHSKFLPSLLVVDSKRINIPHISGKHVGKGTALNSLSSILSLIGSPLHSFRKGAGISVNPDSITEESKSILKENVPSDVNKMRKNSRERVKDSWAEGVVDDLNRLEIVKLLRILLGARLKQFALGTLDVQSLPLNEIMSVLLAAYGGTLSLVDQEIFLLMEEIESYGGLGFSGLSGLDYLWGEAALKRRKAKTLNALKEPGNLDELRRQTFKEDLLIDPRRCGLAVLFFPLKRKFGGADIGQLGLADQYKSSSQEVLERSAVANDEEDVKSAAYDPAFLLPFALHGLSIGCINAEEFVQLGLLAIAFASMSSAEESMRKAGYKVLAKYLTVLEDGPSFKGRLQIRLLMNYIKNAVAEPWQRIPVVFSVFAAEASCILMHPESHQYAIINRFLLQAPGLDLESIPLFQVMFGSGSVQYRSDRLWMFRLLASGLRTSLDARVYRRNFVLELLMSFHDSSMADTFPRKWVLQVLYQAAGVRSFAHYLVEHTGLLSWLSSVAVNDIEGGLGLQNDGGSGQIASKALQVIERVLSWGKLNHQHFLLDCLEELSKAGHVFHQLLVRNPTQQYQNLIRRSTLEILLTLVSLSQKRRKHQTRFTLNLGGLVEVLHWVGSAAPPAIKSMNLHTEPRALALLLILHVAPLPVCSYEDKLYLLKVASWSQSVALELETHNATGSCSLSGILNQHSRTKEQVQESLSEKLLRWLAASVVLGELAKDGSEIDSREKFFSSSVIGCKHTKFSELDTSTTKIDEKLASLLLALEGFCRKTDGVSLVPVVAALIALTRLTRSSIPPGDSGAEVAQQKIQCVLELLLLELPCPEEAHSSWQWSFNSTWTARDESVQSTDHCAVQAQYVSEICRAVLILLQQILSRQPIHYTTHFPHFESLLLLKAETDYDSDDDSIRKKVGIKLSRLQTRVCKALQRTSSR